MYVGKYQLGNCTSRALAMFSVLAVHLWTPMISAPFVPPTQEVQSTLMLRTATCGLQLNVGNELFSPKVWVSLSGLMSAFGTLWSKNLPAWFDGLNSVLPAFPWGLLWMSCSTLISHTCLLAPGMCDSGGSFFFHRDSGGISKSARKGRRQGLLCASRERTVTMPLNSWYSPCGWGNQTLLGLINMPKSKERVGTEVGKWTQRFWHAAVCASS